LRHISGREERNLSLLKVEGLRVHYGKALILDGIDLKIDQGEFVGVIGPNGAGKTTLLRAISNVAPVEGMILFQGERIDSLSPEKIVRLGVIHSPEGRHLFPDLSVMENIELGAYLRNDREGIEQDKADILEMFPILQKREKQSAGTLSGGEQQMLTLARSLMGKPSLLLLDEPSTGLALLVKQDITGKIKEIRERGVTTLLVEQDTQMAFELADRIYVFEHGKIAMEGMTEGIASDPYVKEVYLGMA
jgi:branched-chain amino acid transport system ATP-binding protein